MIFHTYGDKRDPAILLIHPMFTDKDFFAVETKLLSENHYLIVPTLSGHYIGSIYTSMEEEINLIDHYLSEQKIDKINDIVGFSLGGNIAYTYFCTHTDSVRNAVIDSAPLFAFPGFVKRFFYHQYKQCLLQIKQSDANIAEELDKCFHGMGEKQKTVAPMIDLRSLEGLIESCYSLKLFDLNRDAQSRLTFVYGCSDIARLCLPRLRKYPFAKVVKLKGYGHCGLFMDQTDEYIKSFLR